MISVKSYKGSGDGLTVGRVNGAVPSEADLAIDQMVSWRMKSQKISKSWLARKFVKSNITKDEIIENPSKGLANE